MAITNTQKPVPIIRIYEPVEFIFTGVDSVYDFIINYDSIDYTFKIHNIDNEFKIDIGDILRSLFFDFSDNYNYKIEEVIPLPKIKITVDNYSDDFYILRSGRQTYDNVYKDYLYLNELPISIESENTYPYDYPYDYNVGGVATVPYFKGYPLILSKIKGFEIVQEVFNFNRDKIISMGEVYSCDNLYLRWENSRGGVSHWLFDFEEEFIKTKTNFYNVDSDFKLESYTTGVVTRVITTLVPNDYFPFFEALALSKKVDLYLDGDSIENPNLLITGGISNGEWVDVEVSSKMKIIKKQKDVKLSFDVVMPQRYSSRL